MKKMMTISIDDSAIEKLKILAEKENRSISNYIETLIIENYKEVENGNNDN